MNRKHKNGLIAMAIQIAGLEEIVRRHREGHRKNAREMEVWIDGCMAHITALEKGQSTLTLESFAWRECTKDIEKLQFRISRLAAMTEGRQQDTDGVFAAFKERQDLIDTRMRQRDEAVEALDEGLNNLSAGITELEACVLHRIGKIETILGQHTQHLSEVTVKEHSLIELHNRLVILEGRMEASQDAIMGLPISGLVHRIAALETQNRDALEAHRTRGLQTTLILKRLEKLETHIHQVPGQIIERIVSLEQSNEKLKVDLKAAFSRVDAGYTNMKAHTDRREVAVETLQQQVKEINSRLTYLQDTMVEMNKVLKVKEHPPISTEFGLAKRTTRVVSDTAPVSTKNMLAEWKPSRTDKEYKRIMKKGASVG